MIRLVTGASIFEAAKNAINLLSSTNTYIIVPDRATLEMEEAVFSALNLSATFNLNVTGLSTLASRSVGKENMSEIESVLYVKKAVDNVKDKLKYFKAGNINFCKQLYKFISQFKSSSLGPEDIVCKSDREALKNKFADIKLVYEEFEALTADRSDPSEVLADFAEKIETDQQFKNSDFMFLGFDSFTSKHYLILKQIAKHCKSLTISIAQPLSKANAYIYETDILDKLKNIASSLHQTMEIVSPVCNLSGGARAVAEGLFAKEVRPSSANVTVKEAAIPKNEAEFVAKTICYLVYKGARYRDFAVACSDLKKYADELAIEFEKHGIPYYIDSSITADETYTALFFKKLISFSYKRFRKSDLLFFVNSPFFDFDAEIAEKVALNYEDGAENFFAHDYGVLTNLVKLVSADFMAGAQAALSYISGCQGRLDEQLDAKTLALETQMPEILQQLLEAIKQTQSASNIKEFLAAVEIGLQSKEVSALPSYYDQVFVGDATDSFFGEVDSLFLVGASTGALPKYESESSFLSDSDIENAGFKFKVEPTIKMINRRNRFKLFSLLSQFKSRLFVSYPTSDAEGKPLGRSGLVSSLIRIFGIKEGEIVKNLITPEDSDARKLLLAVGRNRAVAKQLLASRRAEKFDEELKLASQTNLDKLKLAKNLSCASQLGLGQQIKPTEIEKFYDCPFKVYCENVLHLTQLLKNELSPAELGSLVHEVVARYGKRFGYQSVPFSRLDAFLTEEISKLLSHRQLSDRELFESRLKRDLVKIIEKITNENADSPFELWLIEEKLEGSIHGKAVAGRADRVDKCKNYFRVIDYKTGRITTNLLSDLKYGKKLQLAAYASLLERQSGMKCAGVYYFDVKLGYKAAQKSSLVGITTQQAEELGVNVKKNSAVTEEQMQELLCEAQRLLASGADLIGQGKLAPYPDQYSCEYCPYGAICLYDANRGKRKGGKA